jgi:hypothetical protein
VRRFKSRADAAKALMPAALRVIEILSGTRGRLDVHSFRCPDCGRWTPYLLFMLPDKCGQYGWYNCIECLRCFSVVAVFDLYPPVAS